MPGVNLAQPVLARVAAESGCRYVDAAVAATRCLLLAARPIGEPVVQYGPFVMNTREEIEQAVRDYQTGRLAAG